MVAGLLKHPKMADRVVEQAHGALLMVVPQVRAPQDKVMMVVPVPLLVTEEAQVVAVLAVLGMIIHPVIMEPRGGRAFSIIL